MHPPEEIENHQRTSLSKTTNAELLQENKRKKLANTIKEWAEGTTPHGLANIFVNRNIILKVIWLISLMASMGYCIQQTLVVIQDYMKYEVHTTVSIIQEAPTVFPAV